MRHGLFRKILATGIVMLFFGTIGISIFSGNISIVAAQVTIYVDDDNTTGPWDGTLANPYQNITSGLAQALNGDTVYVLNGTYDENVVVDKSVVLKGDSKPVVVGTGVLNSRGIDIIVNNVTVEGFNITNSYFGIYTNASGFSITNNVFWHDSYGFYWYISESSLAEDYTVRASTVESNEFYMNTNYDAVYVYVSLDYNDNSFYDVVIGDITVCNNTFHMDGTTATGIELDGGIFVSDLYGGTVSVGTLNASENTMYGGDYGIDFYGYLDDVKDVEASVGDVIVNDNVLVNQSYGGMYIDYYDATYWDGNTVGTYGDLIVRGNTITSAYSADGIYISDIGYWEYFDGNASLEVGNVYIEENEIDVGDYGIEFYGEYVGYEMNDNSSLTIGDIFVNDNTISSDSYGIYVDCEYFGEYMYGNSSVTIGNIEFCRNVINSGNDGIYIYEFSEIGYEMYDNSSFTMGSILVNDNTINGDDYGIYVEYFEYFGYYMYGASSFTMDNIEFCGNEINSTYDGMYLYYIAEFGYDMNDNSSFTMGSILVNDNTINSDDDGIYFEYFEYFGAYMDGTSTFVMGDLQFNRNVIDSDGYGLYKGEIYYFGSYLYGTSSFTMGNIEVNENIINSTSIGMWIYQIENFGYDMYDNSSFTMSSILVNHNIITSSPSGDGAMYIEYLENFGSDLYGNSSFTMSNIQINGNTINSTHRGIYIEDLYEFGSYMYGMSSFTMGNIEVCSNQINSEYEGIYIRSLYHAYYMYNNASFTMENITICDNTINSEGNGIFLQEVLRHTRFGYNAADNSTITTGTIEFSQNEIISNGTGMHMADLENATIRDNVILNGSYGLYLLNSQNNTIYHNIFNNTINAYSNGTNNWDNGYPSGGNYWSDYTGIDLFSGPGQNITGSDGIGDTPYDIQIDNQDRYPFTTQLAWDQTPPSITNISQNPEIPDNLETVTVTVVVTDEESGVHNVTLSYSTDGGQTWTNVTMQKTTGDTYQGEILGKTAETHVQYKIIAYDNIGNPAVEDNAGEYYIYTVIPEFPSAILLPLFVILVLIAVALAKKNRHKTTAKTT